MATNRVKAIHEHGQSIWLDFIERKFIRSGELQKLIDEDGVRGITSNPAIFEKAISGSTEYDEQLKDLVSQSDEDVFYNLAITDIQDAADLFEKVYNEEVEGADGYVSLEVSPELARDTQGTIDQALDLWERVDRKNVMIKIPGTAEGLPAIRKAISEGLNINVTLLFSLDRYEAVTDAYLSGLEDRLAAGQPINRISSVASFFLSRIDVAVDPLLEKAGNTDLKAKVAVASAKKAYEIYKRVFSSERFKKLEAEGAKPQRLLWASTSSKDPAIADTYYVEALIGPDTVDTVPMETLVAFRDHGNAANRLEEGMDEATQTLETLKELGINLDEVTTKLEEEGIEKFIQPYQKLLKAIHEKTAGL
ncbi:transaldolase [Siphonobacter curvatus]|uniref:Transaldolase n=1 Tax=Siphonobacter curvatus TaxID=2094562 RepID=A0A2S7IGY7_9BACT|nr:transaldolase [Siphonobacter curvatus]PQA54934.1 transaldolase [Siphonobacter curvatus]